VTPPTTEQARHTLVVEVLRDLGLYATSNMIASGRLPITEGPRHIRATIARGRRRGSWDTEAQRVLELLAWAGVE
jgi:hypothetical protein